MFKHNKYKHVIFIDWTSFIGLQGQRTRMRTVKRWTFIYLLSFYNFVKMSYSEDLADGLQKLRGSQKFCDVVLIAEETEFYCHKVVLSALSEFFETMFDSPFKVCQVYTIIDIIFNIDAYTYNYKAGTLFILIRTH